MRHLEVNLISSLTGNYYAECNAMFRRSTNQTNLMLTEIQNSTTINRSLKILSIGSGTGLFEIPMLRLLIDKGTIISRFVGIDISEHACRVFRGRLKQEFGKTLKFEVINQSFQEYSSETSFDLILYNHMFEYLKNSYLKWINKSFNLLDENGRIFIFSPNRGGINKIYNEKYKDIEGYEPFFSEDLEKLLLINAINYSTKIITADCNISLLQESNDNQDKIKLLSFLTQIDCRKLNIKQNDEYVRYYLSLRKKNKNTIPHPTTLFIL